VVIVTRDAQVDDTCAMLIHCALPWRSFYEEP
jgi:hypothetical protein